jgi:hypothetical protein
MLDPDGCLARSVMRTQPSTEETGAVLTRSLEEAREKLAALRQNLSDLVANLHIPDMVGLCVYFADIGQFYYQNVIASPFQPRIRRPSSIRKESRLLVALF